jgi:hypothetical protein
LTTKHLHRENRFGRWRKIRYNTQYGDEGNPPLEFIANGKDPEKGQWIRVSVGPDTQSFTVSIGRDGPQRTYPIK